MTDATTAPSLRAPVAGVEGRSAADPYQLRPADITDAPRSLGAVFSRVGPGLVLAASIVGSGELIATTTLGAQVGYAALWVILVSCIVKPVIQAEMGRYTIATGETALEAMNHVPGPAVRRRLGGVGLGDYGRTHDGAGRWDVRWRLAGDAPAGAGRSGARVGGRVPGDHAGAAARRRLRPRRAVRDGQGRAVHAHHDHGGRRAAAHAAILRLARSRAGLDVPSARPGTVDGRCRVRHHRRRRRGAVHVSLLVCREGLRALHRRARRIAPHGSRGPAGGSA